MSSLRVPSIFADDVTPPSSQPLQRGHMCHHRAIASGATTLWRPSPCCGKYTSPLGRPLTIRKRGGRRYLCVHITDLIPRRGLQYMLSIRRGHCLTSARSRRHARSRYTTDTRAFTAQRGISAYLMVTTTAVALRQRSPAQWTSCFA